MQRYRSGFPGKHIRTDGALNQAKNGRFGEEGGAFAGGSVPLRSRLPPFLHPNVLHLRLVLQDLRWDSLSLVQCLVCPVFCVTACGFCSFLPSVLCCVFVFPIVPLCWFLGKPSCAFFFFFFVGTTRENQAKLMSLATTAASGFLPRNV